MSGLREQKKRRTRDELSAAAVRLCVERGWASVTVEDIAAAAGVSVRTVGNYFPGGKAEVVASRHLDRMHDAADALAARPPGEPLAEAVTASFVPQFAGDTDAGAAPPEPSALRLVGFVLETPELHAAMLRANAVAEGRLAEVIAGRSGAGAGDLRPALTAAVVVAAVGFALARWLRADPPVALTPLLREVLGHVGDGFGAA